MQKEETIMFHNPIAATDLVLTRDKSVLTAARIARMNRRPLHVIHVLECATTEGQRFMRHYRNDRAILVDEEYIGEVRGVLEDTYRDVLSGAGEVVFHVVPGRPWEETIRWADEIRSNLIVLGTRSGKAIARGAQRIRGRVGSTTERIIMHEHCPVIIINPRIDPEALNFRTLLVAVDFSRSCGHALRYAERIASHYGSSVHAFHMVPVPPTSYSQSDYERDLAAAEKRLDAFLALHWKNGAVERHVGGGVHPNLEIVSCAEKARADLIVMGSHTIEKDGKWYVGSAVERTSYRATCPVAVISSADAVADS